MIKHLLIFIIASVVGYKLISDVPKMLHTPLMSGMNALSGITVIGSIVITAAAVELDSQILGSAAIIMAVINIMAGFQVTHKMLKKFKDDKTGDRS